jgi:hypothetical protein
VAKHPECQTDDSVPSSAKKMLGTLATVPIDIMVSYVIEYINLH